MSLAMEPNNFTPPELMESIFLTWKKRFRSYRRKYILSCWREQISSLHQYGENRSYSDSINQRSEFTIFPYKIPVSLDVNYGRCLIFVLEFRRVIQTVHIFENLIFHHINSSGVLGYTVKHWLLTASFDIPVGHKNQK